MGKIIKGKIKLQFIVLSLILSLVITSKTNAQIIYPHWYARQGTETAAVRGGYFLSPVGRSALFSNWTPDNYNSFITNEMWVGLDPGVWIEAGDVDGAINEKQWAGSYFAYTGTDGLYREYHVGNEYPAGGISYSIYNIGNYNWQIYVNGYQAGSNLNMLCNDGIHVRVGIESNDTDNFFTNGTYDTYMSTKLTDNQWHAWPTVIVSNLDSNPVGWKSSYSAGNNMLTYTHP